MKNVLITGSDGFVGKAVLRSAPKNGFNLIMIDRNPINRDTFKLNLNDYEAVRQLFKEYEIDYVIHLAAQKNVLDSYVNPKPFFLDNVASASNLINLCIEFEVSKFVFASSAAIYGNASGLVKEDELSEPLSPYGQTKLLIEDYMQQLSVLEVCKTDFCILRFFNIFESQDHDNSSPDLISTLKKVINKESNLEIRRFANHRTSLNCARDFIANSDVADAIWKSIQTDTGRFAKYNVSTGRQIEVQELLNIIESEGFQITTNYVDVDFTEVEGFAGDNKLIGKDMQWSHKIEIKHWLLEYLTSQKESRNV